MSDAVEIEAVPAAAEKAKVPILGLILGIVLAVSISTSAVGGAMFWLIKSGRLSLQSSAKTDKVTPPTELKTKLVPLEPVLVNLADADGHSFLRTALTLKVEDVPKDKKDKAAEEKGASKNEFDALERDTMIEVLSSKTGADLLKPNRKELLKKELQAELKERVPEAKVVEVLFTEFLVQR